MAKQYHLMYEFMGEARNVPYDTLFEFQAALDRVADEPNVPNSTIDFSTSEKVVPVKKPRVKRRGNGVKFKPEFAPKKE